MKSHSEYYADWERYFDECEKEGLPEREVLGAGEWVELQIEKDFLALEAENALLKQELAFLARLDIEVSRWNAAQTGKPNSLPKLNEIAEIEERILSMVLTERAGK